MDQDERRDTQPVPIVDESPQWQQPAARQPRVGAKRTLAAFLIIGLLVLIWVVVTAVLVGSGVFEVKYVD